MAATCEDVQEKSGNADEMEIPNPIPKLDSDFIVSRWLSRRARTGNLDADRCFKILVQKLRSTSPNLWQELFAGKFYFVNWEETNELYWGPDFRSNPEFVEWCAFRYDEFSPGDGPTSVYYRTQDHIGRYFTHPALKRITAALMVKLYELNGDNHGHVLGKSVNEAASKELTGEFHSIWKQQLTLSAELLEPLAVQEDGP